MSPWLLVAVLLVTLLALTWVFNHALARLAFIELALTNGLMRVPVTTTDAGNGITRLAFDEQAAETTLPSDAVVVFASNTCTTCIRLIDDLGAPDVTLDTELHILFSSTKPNIAVPGTWTDKQQGVFDQLGIPATPYLVVMSGGRVATHGPVPNAIRMQFMMQSAGLSDHLPTRLLAHAEGMGHL